MHNDMAMAIAAYEADNYELILREALETNNIEIVEFCRIHIYPSYIDAALAAEIDIDVELVNIFGGPLE